MSEEAVGGGCLGTSLKLNFPGRKCLLAYTHPCGCSANKDARLLRLAEEPCEEGFVAGQPHIQHKFCQRCRIGFAVSVSRVRALSDAQLNGNEFNNGFQAGFWNCSLVDQGTPPFRVINHHARCRGPVLVLFKGDAPTRPDWAPIPSEWIRRADPSVDDAATVASDGSSGDSSPCDGSAGACIWLRVGYNTIMPLDAGYRKRRARTAEASVSGGGERVPSPLLSHMGGTPPPPEEAEGVTPPLAGGCPLSVPTGMVVGGLRLLPQEGPPLPTESTGLSSTPSAPSPRGSSAASLHGAPEEESAFSSPVSTSGRYVSASATGAVTAVATFAQMCGVGGAAWPEEASDYERGESSAEDSFSRAHGTGAAGPVAMAHAIPPPMITTAVPTALQPILPTSVMAASAVPAVPATAVVPQLARPVPATLPTAVPALVKSAGVSPAGIVPMSGLDSNHHASGDVVGSGAQGAVALPSLAASSAPQQPPVKLDHDDPYASPAAMDADVLMMGSSTSGPMIEGVGGGNNALSSIDVAPWLEDWLVDEAILEDGPLRSLGECLASPPAVTAAAPAVAASDPASHNLSAAAACSAGLAASGAAVAAVAATDSNAQARHHPVTDLMGVCPPLNGPPLPTTQMVGGAMTNSAACAPLPTSAVQSMGGVQVAVPLPMPKGAVTNVGGGGGNSAKRPFAVISASGGVGAEACLPPTAPPLSAGPPNAPPVQPFRPLHLVSHLPHLAAGGGVPNDAAASLRPMPTRFAAPTASASHAPHGAPHGASSHLSPIACSLIPQMREELRNALDHTRATLERCAPETVTDGSGSSALPSQATPSEHARLRSALETNARVYSWALSSMQMMLAQPSAPAADPRTGVSGSASGGVGSFATDFSTFSVPPSPPETPLSPSLPPPTPKAKATPSTVSPLSLPRLSPSGQKSPGMAAIIPFGRPWRTPTPITKSKLSWLPPQLCFVWVVIYGLIAMQKNNDLLQMLLLMLLPVGGMTFAAVRFPESSVSPSEAKYITGCFVVQIAMAIQAILVITERTKNEASPEVKAVKRGTSFASALLLFVFGVITSLAIGILGHPQPASTASSCDGQQKPASKPHAVTAVRTSSLPRWLLANQHAWRYNRLSMACSGLIRLAADAALRYLGCRDACFFPGEITFEKACIVNTTYVLMALFLTPRNRRALRQAFLQVAHPAPPLASPPPAAAVPSPHASVPVSASPPSPPPPADAAFEVPSLPVCCCALVAAFALGAWSAHSGLLQMPGAAAGEGGPYVLPPVALDLGNRSAA